MIFLALFSLAVALAFSALFIRSAQGHARRYDQTKVQRFHKGDIPRIGGVAILLGLMAGWGVAAVSAAYGDAVNTAIDAKVAVSCMLVVLPAALAGAWEDVTQEVSILLRFGMTMLSAALACWLLDLQLGRLGIPSVDGWLAAMPAAGILLAFFALCGAPHAFNLIDGYNGLAGTVALLICMALVHVALANGDRQLAGLIVCVAGATAGFLFWNYPRGSIFAGDGGAYLWGITIGVASLALVQRHPMVSPWFPMLLLIYPVCETLFSIYRKVARGSSPGVADALHFHQLIYRRIVRNVFHEDETRRVLSRNNRTSPYLWGFTVLTVAPALLFWSNTAALMFFCAVSVIAYVAAYLMIVRFKVPPWVRRAPSGVRRHVRARVHQPLHGTGYGRRHSAAEPQAREATARREVVGEHEPT
ncbi:glycosyltransferase [Ramlibacter monticola]|uniref:Glycosyltransferase family 4 protein n=1 Tax=Ramlibacter monticola TaxID=1926872 RepID=A0A936YY45_9BURK|nr:glycosyltransferase [Ramlibacter monticola]MBL0391063.1 glycosyltransferase family 4 protein [Ramlibacter monticola]